MSSLLYTKWESLTTRFDSLRWFCGGRHACNATKCALIVVPGDEHVGNNTHKFFIYHKACSVSGWLLISDAELFPSVVLNEFLEFDMTRDLASCAASHRLCHFVMGI